MALDFMDDMKKFEMLQKSTKEVYKGQSNRMATLDVKLKKINEDLKYYTALLESQKKSYSSGLKSIEQLEMRTKSLNDEYSKQNQLLKKVDKAYKYEKTVSNLKAQKEQEAKVNKILKERAVIRKKLESQKKISAKDGLKKIQLESKYNKKSIDLQATQSKKTIMQNGISSDQGKNKFSFFKESMTNIKKLSTIMFAIRTTFEPIAMAVSSLSELEKKITTLGVVAGKSNVDIRNLRSQLLEMSTTSIYSAKALSESMEQIVRTGKTIEDAKNIVSKSINLATASFESLSFATMTVNKAMVALGISSLDAGKVVNTFHNVVLSTPLDLRTLDESLRQTASAFGTIIKFSGRTGEELENYKLEVLDTVSALTGAMGLLGYWLAQVKFL